MLGTFLRTLHATTPLWRAVRPWTKAPQPWDSQNPIREELFGIERLEDHASSLAKAQLATLKPTRGHSLVAQLRKNGVALRESYQDIQGSIDEGHAITPAAEWLVDNFHLVERQIWEIRADLPHGYYRQLPKLISGPFAGYPRVFGMAWAFVAHTDSRFDTEMLLRYTRAYQEEQPLTIGELWAISITLRIVLIENLTRVAGQIVRNRLARKQADAIADRLLGVEGRTAEPVSVVLAGHESGVLSGPFAVQLVHRLRDQDPTVTPALSWLDRRLAAQGMTADALVREVHRRQGAANVTMRNVITSLRLISDVDWKHLFEQMSLVDDVLADGSAFGEMDFPTRNLYRSAIEELARGSNRTELDIGRAAVLAAHSTSAAGPAGGHKREADPGYHLLAEGRRTVRGDGRLPAAVVGLANAAEPQLRHRRLWGTRCRRHCIPACTAPGCFGQTRA